MLLRFIFILTFFFNINLFPLKASDESFKDEMLSLCSSFRAKLREELAHYENYQKSKNMRKIDSFYVYLSKYNRAKDLLESIKEAIRKVNITLTMLDPLEKILSKENLDLERLLGFCGDYYKSIKAQQIKVCKPGNALAAVGLYPPFHKYYLDRDIRKITTRGVWDQCYWVLEMAKIGFNQLSVERQDAFLNDRQDIQELPKFKGYLKGNEDMNSPSFWLYHERFSEKEIQEVRLRLEAGKKALSLAVKKAEEKVKKAEERVKKKKYRKKNKKKKAEHKIKVAAHKPNKSNINSKNKSPLNKETVEESAESVQTESVQTESVQTESVQTESVQTEPEPTQPEQRYEVHNEVASTTGPGKLKKHFRGMDVSSKQKSRELDIAIGKEDSEQSLEKPKLRRRHFDTFQEFWTNSYKGFYLGYDRFKAMFAALGGRVDETTKMGSHIRLIFKNHAFKGHSWKPHGGVNGFGLYDRKYLRDYFARWGLTLDTVSLKSEQPSDMRMNSL